jgi:glutamyl-tRNA synthetase
VLHQPPSQQALAALQALLAEHPTGSPLETQAAQNLLEASAAAAGVKKGVMMKSLRAALLGSLQGPDLLSSWQLLHQIGEDEKRLAAALQD